ncbi:sensor histidine kinase [Bradyrhizobium hipponense]|uniref:histidine kinase n=1 Tax=Bradyrhizobium hipponense TaxID=2605638 RepID=A0A5S4YAM5_9BRAD|nr:sensor histidine kinase [Bradyrhizobium hipponense]TYO61466.1 sensor histidine kinase [Bradyrhizobium hipponense]
MIKHIVRSANSDESLLLRELNHRIENELTSAIYTVSAKAMHSDNVAVKAALLDVVDLLHQCADVHRAQRMPDRGRLTDAAKYLQQLCLSITKYRLNRLAIRFLFSTDDLRLEGTRCWKLGLIVSELLTNTARHAQFDAGNPELRVELKLAGSVVKCRVSDNGSAPETIRRGRGLAIIGELASRLGGRVHTSCAADGYSFLLTFPLTEAEQRAAGAAHAGLKQRKMGRPQRLQASRAENLGGWLGNVALFGSKRPGLT